MDINDVRDCAQFYKENYLETFYIICTYSGKSFILVGEKDNFPHLVGIRKNVYNSNGYRSPRKLFQDILDGVSISSRIIPHNIVPNSKMYNKILNFQESTEIFWNNRGILAINYNNALSSTRLSNVDIILADISTGYMLGWIINKNLPINAEIKLTKYCISSWIDESGGTQSGKEKYMPLQDVDLIREVLSFDKNSDLLRRKEYKYDQIQKEDILNIVSRNNANLLIDSRNVQKYIRLAQNKSILCKINGNQH